MNIGDIVIVREDAENWSQSFMQKRKFIVVDIIGPDSQWVPLPAHDREYGRANCFYYYTLRTYNWPQKIKEDVFSRGKDFVFITKAESKELIILDKEFIKNNTLRKFKLQ